MDEDRAPWLPGLYKMWWRIGPAATITLIIASLTLVVTFPVVTQLGSSLAQNPEGSHDAYHHTYVLWWFKKALLDLHISPADLRLINFPDGGYYPLLLTHSTVYVVGLPFLLFMSPTVTYNILFLLTFFLSGLSGYALCAYLTRSRWAGLLGGIVYAFFPNRMAHALSGHLELISTYLFPLYLLFLIKTTHRPRLVTSLLCGLVLAASLLVQPLFIPFLLVPITFVWLLYEALILYRRIERRALFALAGAFGLAVLFAIPFFWPVLRQQMRGQGGYLQAPGLVLFSADLLGIVSPSPLNPLLNALGLVPSYAHDVLPAFRSIRESLVYVGIIPLALAALAFYGHRRKVGAWVLLALGAALFSLGPLLKVSGRLVTFTVENHESAVPLPYALLMNLPLLSYNRAPARINTTLMLVVAVLSAYGLSYVLTWIRSRWRNVVAVVLCLLTLGEFLVVWPFPTTPVRFPAGLTGLAHIPEHDEHNAVLNLPVASWAVTELALFYQTLHKHPIFGGWVQRSLSGSGNVDEFLDRLFSPSSERDVVPVPSANTRAAIARAQGVGHILFFNNYARDAEAQGELLSDAFGPPQSTGEEVALYQVPPGPAVVDEFVYALPAEHWWSIETWDNQPARWMPEQAELYIYSLSEQEGMLRFTALPLAAPQRLQIEVNDSALPPLVIGDWMTYTTSLCKLQPGLNYITFRAMGGCTSFVGDPRCAGPARAAGADCNPHISWERCLSVLFQDIRFSPGAAGPAEHPLDVVLDDHVRFLGYDLEGDPAPGEPLLITLYWQILDVSEKDHVIFVHLLGPGGDLLTQQDAPPLNGSYPTSKWVASDIFLHQVTLEVPVDAPPGGYDLVTGMYTYPDIKRLPVASDCPYAQHGLIWLQSVSIQP